MTQKELYNQRLLNEANAKTLSFWTRRHFLRESAMGLGALALGSLVGGCGPADQPASALQFDPANPLAPKPSPEIG